MLHPARFVSEGGGGLLAHSSQLLVLQARDAGIRSEGPQVYVHSDVRSTEELTAVHSRYDSLRSDNAGSSGDAPRPGGDGKLDIARARRDKGESVTSIAKALGVHRATLYRHLAERA
ncbi:helix-turn-helix domain-containing protein [Streptomyces sp. NPDC087512]|uniref:helix-turn-helix domain-containing protein n=1 Tax=Streptomyces sp. NPDC087512 TaxID=3155059 RepID=UPI00341A56CA